MIRLMNLPPVNSGALVQATRRGNSIHFETVEVSASSHVSPAYEFAAEAPRIYGDFGEADFELAWLEWLAGLVADRGSYDFGHASYTRGNRRRDLRTYIESRLDRIPDNSGG